MVITPVITVITLFRTMPLNSYSSKNHQPPPRKEMSEKVVLSNKVPNLSSLHLTQNQHRKIWPWQFKPLSSKSSSPPLHPPLCNADTRVRLSTGSQGTGSQVLDAIANKKSALHNGGVTGGDQDTTINNIHIAKANHGRCTHGLGANEPKWPEGPRAKRAQGPQGLRGPKGPKGPIGSKATRVHRIQILRNVDAEPSSGSIVLWRTQFSGHFFPRGLRVLVCGKTKFDENTSI